MARDAAILTGKEVGKTVRQMAKETGTLQVASDVEGMHNSRRPASGGLQRGQDGPLRNHGRNSLCEIYFWYWVASLP
jgi:hypothetical protein